MIRAEVQARHRAASLQGASDLLRALTAPVRPALIVELESGARCVHDLVESVGASQSLVSQHLRVLRGAGLVSATRRGREVHYELADDHVEEDRP